jgi:hypothetical protein
MPHASVSVVTLRPLDELGPEPARPARGGGAHAREAVHGPAVGGRGVLEMLDLSIAILREHFALLVGLGALAWLPVRLLQPFIGAHVWEDSIGTGAMIGPSLSSLVNTGSAALAQCFASALLARVVHAALEGREVALLPLLRNVLVRLHVVIGVALVSAIASVAGTCACFLPGILLSWKLSAAPMACVIEGQGLRYSLARSWLLTRRGFWRWLFLWLCVVLIGLPFTGITALADWPGARAQALAWSGLSGTSFDIVFVLVSSLMLGVAIALQSSVLTVYYADCRVRREGADLEAQRAQLGLAGKPA